MTAQSSAAGDVIADALSTAAQSAGYPTTHVEQLRTGNNYIYADRSNGLIYRVPVLERQADNLAQENGLLLDLASAGAPIVAPSQQDPLRLSTGDLATVWPLGGQPDPNPAVSLAPTLASLHDVPPVDGLRRWDGFERGHRRVELARATGVPSELVDEVSQRLSTLEAQIPDWTADKVVHGDPHTGNLVKIDGQHLLIDLDDIATGSPEIDLAVLRTAYTRFDVIPGSWDQFLAAYGRPATRDTIDWFARVRQVSMVAWLFTLWDLRPESQQEAIHRVSTLDTAAVWNPL
ncbi:MAG: phosphotransferase [Actinomycetota bacterium]